MNCCRQCFEDPFLKQYIAEHGEEGDCEYCGARDDLVIEAADLCDLFQRFLDLYVVSNDGTGESLAFLIEDDWGIFNDKLVVSGEHHDLLHEILKGHASEEDCPMSVIFGERTCLTNDLRIDGMNLLSPLERAGRKNPEIAGS